MARRNVMDRHSLRRCVAVLSALACCAALAPVAHTRSTGRTQRGCHVTIPTRAGLPGPVLYPAGFEYGTRRLRVHLGWLQGTLPAGVLPDGGSWATVEKDGSIHAKLGWWRGVQGRLRVTGRRLDATAPPLRASVPRGYGPRGLQPSGLVFPTVGCWRVAGAMGNARLAFVVKVTKLPRR